MSRLFDKQHALHLPILILSGLFFFIPFLWSVHLFDWDEINFAESAREMLVTGDYFKVQINFKPFWEKPPLFFWLQAAAMQLLGVNEFAARLPNALFGVLTLFVFYRVGKRLYDGRFGFLWGVVYLGSFLPHLYFKSAIIDPVFNFFIFLGIVYLAMTIHHRKQPMSLRYAIYAGVFTGLAVLTKGPVGFLLVFLTFLVFWIAQRFTIVTSFKNILAFAISILLVTSVWYGVELAKNGIWFFEEFIRYQIRLLVIADAGHEQPFYYHFVVVFLGCFPMSAFALKSFVKKEDYDDVTKPDFRLWMLILFWVVMIVFTIVKTKIVHYSSMAYFPLSFLAAYSLYFLLERDKKVARYTLALVVVLGTVFSVLLIGLPLFAYYKNAFYHLIDDPFAVACLKTEVQWGGWEFLFGLIYWLMVIVGSWLLERKQFIGGILSIFYATAFCMLGYLAVIVPKVEAYSQRPAVNFYEQLQGEDVYVSTLWFKSYAHYFYFKVPPYNHSEVYDEQGRLNEEWLLEGNVDKKVYFVLKVTDIERMQKEHPQFRLLKREGGFAFFVRDLKEEL
ncbi:MAG: ArnT family glycosyltransferase [Thermonemataceae bacterium]